MATWSSTCISAATCLYARYCNRKPSKWLYVPVVFIAIIWAVSIHTITAFLYVGLGGRPFWNTAIIGPRFLASAFTAGPALIILALQVVRRVTAIAPEGAAALPPWATPEVSPTHRPATMKDLEMLASRLPQLEAVPLVTRRGILEGATVLDVPPGGVLLHQGMTEANAFFVLEGRVVVKREEHGRFRIIRSIGPGEQFGEISALTERARRHRRRRRAQPGPATAGGIPPPPDEESRDGRDHRVAEVERLMISDRGLLILRESCRWRCSSIFSSWPTTPSRSSTRPTAPARPPVSLFRPSRLPCARSLDLDLHCVQRRVHGAARPAAQPKAGMA